MATIQTALKKIFIDESVDAVNATDVLSRLTPNTYKVYSSQVKSAGLVIMPENAMDGLIKLTEAGKKVLTASPSISSTGRAESIQPPVYRSKPVLVIPSLDEVTNITDRFNRSSKQWEWRLVRKGTSM